MDCRILVLAFGLMGLPVLSALQSSADPARQLSPDQISKLKNCLAKELAKISTQAGFVKSDSVNCDKADLPACETKTNSQAIDYKAPPDSIIVAASSRVEKDQGSRDVNIDSPTISPDEKSAEAHLTCRGWGCEPQNGGTSGKGYVEGTTQHQPTRQEIDHAVISCL